MTLKSWEFDYVKHLMYQKSAFVVEEAKSFTVETRLRELARAEGLSTPSELIAKLRSGTDRRLVERFVDHMTNHETLFFRDDALFESLGSHVFPEIIERNRTRRSINIWSAASSSGQEAYSVAILLHELLPDLAGWSVRILATDVSAGSVARTRDGVYSAVETARGLSPRRRDRYFDKVNGQFQVIAQLRNLLECRQLNLAETWPLIPKMDLILLRNVLIYFDVATKQNILGQVRRIMDSEGYLILGGGESTFNLDNRYQKVQLGRAVVYRRGDDAAPAREAI